ncbi:MAG: thioredoxin family protein [Candidatus Helarchaeota archaeon]
MKATEIEPAEFVHIEFFYGEDCPYCPTVRKMLDELIKSELGSHVIIEAININSPAGTSRVRFYSKLKGVPAIAIDGILKFMGVPHPTKLFNEVKKLTIQNKESEPAKFKFHSPSKFSKKGDNLTFYT